MDCHIGAVAKRILLHNYSFLRNAFARKYQRGGILTRSVIGMMPTTCQVRKARVTIQNYDEALRKTIIM